MSLAGAPARPPRLSGARPGNGAGPARRAGRSSWGSSGPHGPTSETACTSSSGPVTAAGGVLFPAGRARRPPDSAARPGRGPSAGRRPGRGPPARSGRLPAGSRRRPPHLPHLPSPRSPSHARLPRTPATSRKRLHPRRGDRLRRPGHGVEGAQGGLRPAPGLQDPAPRPRLRARRGGRLPQGARDPETDHEPERHRGARHRRRERHARTRHGLRRRRGPRRSHPVPRRPRTGDDRLPGRQYSGGRRGGARRGRGARGHQARQHPHRLVHDPGDAEDSGLRHREDLRLDGGDPHGGGNGDARVHGPGGRRRGPPVPGQGRLRPGDCPVSARLRGAALRRQPRLPRQDALPDGPRAPRGDSGPAVGPHQQNAGQGSRQAPLGPRGLPDAGPPDDGAGGAARGPDAHRAARGLSPCPTGRAPRP